MTQRISNSRRFCVSCVRFGGFSPEFYIRELFEGKVSGKTVRSDANDAKEVMLVDLKIEGLTDATDQLRNIYDSLLRRLERGAEIISQLPSGEARKKAEATYKNLADARQRIALALDMIEERAEVEERGSSKGRCYLVILPEMED